MKKAMALVMRAKLTTPLATPPAIAPALLLCEPLLPEPKEGATVTINIANSEIVQVDSGCIVDDGVDSGASTTNFQIRKFGIFERLTSIYLSSSWAEYTGGSHIQECPAGNRCPR